MSSVATSPGKDGRSSPVAGWAVLAIDKLWLALPQRDVRQFELVSDLEAPADGTAQEAGRFVTGRGEFWPAYNLDESLKLQRGATTTRRLCVFFEGDGRPRGLFCDRVWSLSQDTDLVVEAVPGCITGPSSPTTGLAQFRNRIAVVTNRAAISAYLALLLEQSHVEHQN